MRIFCGPDVATYEVILGPVQVDRSKGAEETALDFSGLVWESRMASWNGG